MCVCVLILVLWILVLLWVFGLCFGYPVMSLSQFLDNLINWILVGDAQLLLKDM